MSIAAEAFPRKHLLWRGALLGSVVHSIMAARYPELAHEQSWDGMNYSVQNSMGSRATISFAGEDVVAAFFDADSPRNPYGKDYAKDAGYDMEPLLQGLPQQLRQFAQKEALMYLLDDYQEQTLPIITAFFWGEGHFLAAAERWAMVYENGAHLIRNQLLGAKTGLASWQDAYGMSPRQTALAEALFNEKVNAPEKKIELNAQQIAILQSESTEEGLNASRALFAEIGISLP